MLNFRQLATVVALSTTGATATEVDFARDIQPILSEYCYNCHGPDAGSREAELRLDTREGALREKDGVTVVKPGDGAHSELLRRVLSNDPELVMPPPKSKRVLSATEKEKLSRWIEEGAKWGEHWAFVAPRRQALPPGAAHPVDAFIGARLAKEGLTPSPPASSAKLLRRVSLDLTGLPPTLSELDAFLADPSPDAYEKAVDRLLSSPRFGERMAWDWLDAARYADTNGFQGDPTRAMWYWRDWVIRALNGNMPFDQFTIEQLAGDLLPSPTQDQLVATGFHRNHMINGEGGRAPEESRVEYVMDRTETTGTVWLGLTVQCSRCHDHKFDPVSQAEYYQLSAFFNSIDETGGNDANGLAHPVMSLATPEDTKRIDALAAEVSSAQGDHEELTTKLEAGQAAWEESLARHSPTVEWTALHPVQASSAEGAVLTPQSDGSILASGANPDGDEYVISARTSMKGVTAFRIEALPDASLVNGGPGRADNGNFVLGEVVVTANGSALPLDPLSADFEQRGWPVSGIADGKPDTGWAIMPEFGKAHEAIIPFAAPFPDTVQETALSFHLRFRSPHRQHTLGRFRLSISTAPRSQLRQLPAPVKAALEVPAERRNAAQRKEVRQFYLEGDPRFIASGKRLAAAKKKRQEAEDALPKTMVMRERKEPRETFVLIKGSYENRGNKVSHGVPAFLPPLPAGGKPDRLALARWLVSAEHPLTARVTVNRYWQMLFGTGLVKTSEDFGVQGERPIHPELLDWLAIEFRDSGWDVKKLLRLIVTSRTYRQSSVVPPGMAERDPDNRLLARGPRHRLPSWMLRDQALAASGLLVEKNGGPPVKGYQPEGVWEDATFGQIKYVQDHGDALYRRSLYTFWRRIVGPTMFFDVASRQTCSVKTGLTNTPLHALVTLNDVTYTEASRVLGQRMIQEAGSDEARLAHGFRLCTSRPPDEKDMKLLLSALALIRQQYAADPAAAKTLVAVGESKPDPAIDAVELAAFTGVANLLLNLDETLCNE